MPRASARPVSTAGSTPAPPAVGAATMTPIAAFTSCTASARARMSRNGVPASGPAGPVRSLAASPPTSPDAEIEIAGHPPLHRAAHHVERALKRGANVLDGAALVLRLGLEREARERDALLLRVADGVGERRGTSGADLVEAERPAHPGQRANLVAHALRPGTSSISMTMNASPPRCFRVRRSVAMLMLVLGEDRRDARRRSPSRPRRRARWCDSCPVTSTG